ncbi:MAG: hypothetical protein ABII79_03695 [bacterium]
MINQIPLWVAASTGAIVIIAVVYRLASILHYLPKPYYGGEGRLEAFRTEKKELCLYAGEAWWEVYRDATPIIKAGHLHIAIVMGNTVSHYPDAVDKGLIDANGYLTIHDPKQIDKIREVHPLFAIWLDSPERISIWIKSINEVISHFALLTSARLAYVEAPKGVVAPSKGLIHSDPHVYDRLERRFKGMSSQSEAACRLKPGHPELALQMLRQVRFSNEQLLAPPNQSTETVH